MYSSNKKIRLFTVAWCATQGDDPKEEENTGAESGFMVL